MCISKPQKVLSCRDGRVLVEFEGEKKTMHSPIPLRKGEYVLCQAGFVAKKISKSDANEMLKEWRDLNDF
jgi:hydrogenase assembly chaperone HypC/HupF